MALKKFGSADLAAATWTDLYSGGVPTGKTALAQVRFVNRNAATVTVRLGIATSSPPGDADLHEYNWTLQPAGVQGSVLDNTRIPMQAGEHVYAYASGTGVSVNARGDET